MPVNESNKALYDAAEAAITALFSDESVTKEEALENMQALKGEIETKIEALENDIENEELDSDDEDDETDSDEDDE